MKWIMAAIAVVGIGSSAIAQNVGYITCAEYLRISQTGTLAEKTRVADYIAGWLNGASLLEARRSFVQGSIGRLCVRRRDDRLFVILHDAKDEIPETLPN